ncbi:MAG: thioredoxin domain-containing protein [Bryobacteraceae bacterium]
MRLAAFALGAATLGVMLQAQPLIEGKVDSPVKVVIYEDLQCSDCAAFRKMMDEHLLPRFRATVAFIHRDFPLTKHAWARKAAIAARHFADLRPELGVAFRRSAMEGISETTEANLAERVAAFAAKNGADAKRAAAALNDQSLGELVDKDFADGVGRGVSKTPTVFVNGVPFIESFSVAEISKAIDQALAETNAK